MSMVMLAFRELPASLGNLHDWLPLHWSGTVAILSSAACGLLIGMERELKSKPAGLRTLTLICIGSTIFTLASIMISLDDAGLGGRFSDRARIAAQIVTGIGFLGAGAILRERGAVTGLTTAATIWTAAAIGVVIGTGYVAAGFSLTAIVLVTLVLVERFERRFLRSCRYTSCRIYYDPKKGLTRLKLLAVLDRHHIPDHAWRVVAHGDQQVMIVEYCHFHRRHRAFLFEAVDVPGVTEILRKRRAREAESGDYEDHAEEED